ncbi:MAG: dihydrodipicolinate synthase family protein [Verrucomicrobia bacterium]|nr:dihydrodipicolinate synthase family protein [Verrucomicrobiota bacterium]
MPHTDASAFSLTGLVAATHTPFTPDGSLNLGAVEAQAAHLLANRVTLAFIGGTTGESHSLTLDERRALARRWLDVARGTPLRVVVHVGSNCLADARTLAAHAQALGAPAVSAVAPSYFKPRSLDALIACAADIAAAAPETPFYFYDIPALTGVAFSMPEFLERAPARIPTLAGLKFTNPDLMAYLQCLEAQGGRWDVPWGIDECLLAALATGARGAVGSTYNFAAPLYHGLIAAFERGDLAAARAAQSRSTRLVALLARYGYMGAAKATMTMLGVDVGPARLPNPSPAPEQIRTLRRDLETLGFFDWIRQRAAG